VSVFVREIFIVGYHVERPIMSLSTVMFRISCCRNPRPSPI